MGKRKNEVEPCPVCRMSVRDKISKVCFNPQCPSRQK